MEEIEFSNSVESSLNLSTDASNIDHSVKVEDDRILSTNKESLDNILSIVAINVRRFAETLNLGDEEQEFVSRCLEVFKDNIQENATINGLPYTANENFLSTIPKEDQKHDTQYALFFKLSNTLQVCAGKRKRCPKEYCRTLSTRLKKESRALRSAAVNHSAKFTRFTKPVFTVDTLSSLKLEEINKNIKSTQTKLHSVVNELQQLKQNINFAKSVVSQKPYLEALHDTGYNSS